MKKYLLDSLDMPKVSTGESIPMPSIVNRQANRANPPAVLPLQFFRRSVLLPFIDTVLEYPSEIFRSDLVDCTKFQFLIPSVSEKHDICFNQKCSELLTSLCG